MEMLQMRKLIKYYLGLKTQKGEPVIPWNHGDIQRDRFIGYLVSTKHFRRDFRDTLLSWYLVEKDRSAGVQHRMNTRVEKQRGEINRLISRCIKREYFDYEEKYCWLSIKIEGEDFVKWSVFFETLLEKYKYLGSFLLGLVSGGFLKIPIREIVNWVLEKTV